MISRRSFLAALACLPFVGKLIPQKTVQLYPVTAPPFPIWQPEIHPKLWFHKDAFALVMEEAHFPNRFDTLYGFGNVKPEHGVRFTEYRTTDRPRLTFAEWDRLHQV